MNDGQPATGVGPEVRSLEAGADGGYHDALDGITPASILSALSIPSRGRVFSLESRWWRGMPVHPVHPSFEVLTYRSPRGLANQKDQQYLQPPSNAAGYSFVSELMIGTSHTGTHVDALAHTVCGERSEWFGGHSADSELGDFGPLNSDAAALRPIIARGVLLDVPECLGVEHCEAAFPIGEEELAKAATSQAVDVREGDVVLVRTGQMKFWPDEDAMRLAAGAGVSISGAAWLSERGVVAVGADTAQFECTPSGVDGNPLPVHVFLMKERGIPILEWVDLEALAEADVHEFLFVCLPLSIVGATGSMVRPVAIA